MTPGCQDTLEQLPEDNLFRFPAAGNAFTLTFYRDAAARAAAQREQLRPAGYEETYDCIACTLVTNGGYLGSSQDIHISILSVSIYLYPRRAGPHLLPALPGRRHLPCLPLTSSSVPKTHGRGGQEMGMSHVSKELIIFCLCRPSICK